VANKHDVTTDILCAKQARTRQSAGRVERRGLVWHISIQPPVVMKRKAEARRHLTACPITGLPIKALTPKKLQCSQGVTAKTLANALKNQLGYRDALEGLSLDHLIDQYCTELQKQLEAPAASRHCDSTTRSPALAVSGRSPSDSQNKSQSAAAQASGGPGAPARTDAMPAPAGAGASRSQSRSAAAQASGGAGALLQAQSSLSQLRVPAASAPSASGSGNPSHSPKVATCSVAGCSRNAWNGQPGQQCCRTCPSSNGCSHGPDCDRKAGHLQASLAPWVGGAASTRPAVPSAAPSGLAAGLPGSPDTPTGGRKWKSTVGRDADDARSRWASPRQAGKESKKLFDVDGGSREFQEVQKQFMATMAGNATIQRIQRVENGHQYEAFLQQKETITEEIAELAELGVHCSNVVRLLFHGTKKDSTHDIIHGTIAGFEPLASGVRTGAIWGNGAYFARDAAYSHKYCEELASGERQMLLNQVLVGLSTQGNPTINLYPKVRGASNQSSRYHSLVDNPQSPTIFVVAHSNQAYPAYLITYR